MDRRGFTLLEVMVAVAILGLGLTAIMSAQAGSFASSQHARNVSIATGLARCRMNEVEERLTRLGLPVADEVETGMCCDGDNNTLFRCVSKVDVPVLPEAKLGSLDLAAGLGDGGIGGTMGSFAQLDQGKALFAGGDGGIGAIAQSLAGGPSMPGMPGMPGSDPSDPNGTGAGVGGLAGMAMGFVYPQLKGIMEASTRRVSVTILWTEGKKEHSFEVMQWVTNPQQAGLLSDAIDPSALPGAGAGAPPGAGGLPGLSGSSGGIGRSILGGGR